ncbi:MAG: serine hydrolase [Fuerstiella sp.]
MRILLPLVVFCCCSAGRAVASSDVSGLPYGRPADVGLDAAGLEVAASLIDQAVQDDELRGAVVLVARRGKIVLHKAFGYSDSESKIAMRPDGLFRMASNSKAVTAAGILLLVQDGKLQLDDPVCSYLPEFDTEKSRDITIRQLLTHTSGLRIKTLFLDPLMTRTDEHPAAPTLLLEVERFGAIGAEVAVGTSYSYNNAGYNTLAGIIEKLTGSYKAFLKERIYDPLGMQDSCNHESDADRSRMSTVFRRADDGQWTVRWKPTDEPDLPFPRGSGGMVSSAADYAVFCQMLLNGGQYNQNRILRQDLVTEATNPQSGKIKAAATYGLGWSVQKPGETWSHSGSDGTWVWGDPQREIIGMVLTQTQKSTNPRKAFRELVNAACTDVATETSSVMKAKRPGFYKDLFMSGGVNLSSKKTLHAAESLGLPYEYYAGKDAILQNRLLIGSENDRNGILLYPDGQPRFRMIYVNGGGATNHGKSLTMAGRETLRQFNGNGGAYCGSCAGSFLSGRNVDSKTARRLGYLHIFPFNTMNTGLKKVRVGHAIPDDSPLLAYRGFGEDQLVEDVYHNNGNWLPTDEGNHASDTEVLATYVNAGHKTHKGAAIWAYRADAARGRIVNIGSHPEGAESGERLALTESCLLYALDGTGTPRLKGNLKDGVERIMSRSTEDELPQLTRIGDGQYHHFCFDVPDDYRDVTVEVRTIEDSVDADMRIYLSRDQFAFESSAVHRADGGGGTQIIRASLEPGTWFLGVECATRVHAIEDKDSGLYRYFGNHKILNGVAYSVQMKTASSKQDSSGL